MPPNARVVPRIARTQADEHESNPAPASDFYQPQGVPSGFQFAAQPPSLPPETTTRATAPSDAAAPVIDPLQDEFPEASMEWNDALAHAAMGSSEADDSTNSEGSMDDGEDTNAAMTVGESGANERLSIPELRSLLRGKTVEALSFVLGSKGMYVAQYAGMSQVMNVYIRALSLPQYPCYTTLLNTSMRILRKSVFVNQCSLVAEVDTTRAGVQLKYLEQQRRGEVPKVNLSAINPSDWGQKDLILFDFMRAKRTPRIPKPANIDIENTSFMRPAVRISLATTVCELYSGDFGFETGLPLREGCKVVVKIHLENSHMLSAISGDSHIETRSVGRSIEVAIRCRMGRTFFVDDNQHDDELLLCDAATELMTEGGRRWRNALLVHRFTPRAGTRSALLRMDGSDGVRLYCRWSSLRTDEDICASLQGSEQCSFGTLSDGRRYAIMRILLYTDDFQPYGFRQASAGGCYILPLGIPVWERSGVNSIRILGVTPAGVSSNVLLNAIIPDISKASSEGVNVPMPDGSTTVLFLDVVGYIGDYPAMVHLLDVNGVHGLAPCNFCTFHKSRSTTSDETGPVTATESSSYAYSTAIHSGNISFRRTRERMAMWRSSASPEDLQRIGLKSIQNFDEEQLPLHRLSRALDSVRHKVPLTSSGMPVVPCAIDPYQGCMVAPDHVLCGVGQDVVQALLALLRPVERAKIDALATHAVISVGYTMESALLSSKSNRLHQMAFSSFFAYLLVIPWSARVVMGLEPIKRALPSATSRQEPTRTKVLRALFFFQELYFKSVFIPSVPVDGVEAVQFMERNGGEDYIRDLQQRAYEYVSMVNDLCALHPRVRSELDKPNIHRFLELYVHSLPKVRHIALIQELILESGHQPLKKAFKRSNHHNAHEFAINRVLADDWEGRVGAVCKSIADTQALTDEDCCRLMQVAFGRQDLLLEGGHVTADDIRQCFPPHVIKRYSTMAETSLKSDERPRRWIGARSTASRISSRTTLSQTERDVTRFLQYLLCNQQSDGSNEYLRRYYSATCVQCSPSNASATGHRAPRGRQDGLNTVHVGCIIQILLNRVPNATSSGDRVCLLTPSQGSGKRTFWFVDGLYGAKSDKTVYAHVTRMSECVRPGTFERVYKRSVNRLRHFVVQLTEHMRRVLALHDCVSSLEGQCISEDVCAALTHCDDLSDSRWTLLGTEEGFPSRSR